MNCCKCNNSSLASFHRHNENNLISFDFEGDDDEEESKKYNSDYNNQLNYYDYRCNVPDHQVQVYRQITQRMYKTFIPKVFLCACFQVHSTLQLEVTWWISAMYRKITKLILHLFFVVSFDTIRSDDVWPCVLSSIGQHLRKKIKIHIKSTPNAIKGLFHGCLNQDVTLRSFLAVKIDSQKRIGWITDVCFVKSNEPLGKATWSSMIFKK